MIIDGRKIAKERLKRIREIIAQSKVSLKLVIILIGNDSSSKIYIKNKVKAAEKVGIVVDLIKLSPQIREVELLNIIKNKNNDISVNGIIVQLPLPENLKYLEPKISDLINPEKDVDGFSSVNLGKTLANKPEAIKSATPKGIITLLRAYKVEILGKNCVVVGASNIVGKPLAAILQNLGGTVTICNSKTKDLKFFTQNADILVVAVGVSKLIKREMVKLGAVVIDVGINRLSGGGIGGDVDFDNLQDKVSLITPVPGGVGPMTVQSLLENVLATKRYFLD